VPVSVPESWPFITGAAARAVIRIDRDTKAQIIKRKARQFSIEKRTKKRKKELKSDRY
jgi:hypothetical protein